MPIAPNEQILAADVVTTATANKIVLRDAAARTKFAAPAAADDAAILSTVTDHSNNTTTAHGAVSAATASKFVVRDGSARAKFAAPNAAGDALIKGTALTITEMAALTTGKIWQGVANRPSEVDMPAAGAITTSGSYTGDNSANRAIPHGLGATPKVVFVQGISGGGAYFFRVFGAQALIFYAAGSSGYAVTIPNATNFYVGNAASYANTANVNTWNYIWVAIG